MQLQLGSDEKENAISSNSRYFCSKPLSILKLPSVYNSFSKIKVKKKNVRPTECRHMWTFRLIILKISFLKNKNNVTVLVPLANKRFIEPF